MTTLNISLPDDVRALADEQVASGRFASHSDYVASLILQDRQRIDQERTQEVLRQRLQSGPSREMTDEDFDRIRQRLEADIAQRQAP
jgi:antitoxin ParD1/3/4